MSEITPEQQAEHERMVGIIEEIATVLKKHDVTGYFSLVSPTMSHFCYHLEATWSAAKIEDGKLQLRCREEDGFTKEQVKQRAHDTVGMIMSHLHLTDTAQKNFLSVALALSEKFGILHTSKHIDPKET